MPGNRQRLALSVRRREAPGWVFLLSLALHLAVLVGLLVKPPVVPMVATPEPMLVEFVMEAGPAETVGQATPPPRRPSPRQPCHRPSRPKWRCRCPRRCHPRRRCGPPTLRHPARRCRRSHLVPRSPRRHRRRARPHRACQPGRRRPARPTARWKPPRTRRTGRGAIPDPPREQRRRLDGPAEAVVGPELLLAAGSLPNQ